jgi:hypothetical protein
MFPCFPYDFFVFGTKPIFRHAFLKKVTGSVAWSTGRRDVLKGAGFKPLESLDI